MVGEVGSVGRGLVGEDVVGKIVRRYTSPEDLDVAAVQCPVK